jgi:hypothetical protein
MQPRSVNSDNFNRNVNVGGGGFYGRLLWEVAVASPPALWRVP